MLFLGKFSSNEKQIGFLIVDPTIYIAGKRLPLEAICMQTVLTKCLGPLSEWQQRLQVAKECGYNALHFTPMQQLGASGSGYSLYDQLTPSSSLNSEGKADVNFDDIHSQYNRIYLK